MIIDIAHDKTIDTNRGGRGGGAVRLCRLFRIYKVNVCVPAKVQYTSRAQNETSFYIKNMHSHEQNIPIEVFLLMLKNVL